MPNNQVNKKVYVDLCVGDVIRFGQWVSYYLDPNPFTSYVDPYFPMFYDLRVLNANLLGTWVY